MNLVTWSEFDWAIFKSVYYWPVIAIRVVFCQESQ